MDDHFNVTEYLGELQTEQILRLGSALGLCYPHLKKMPSLLGDMVEAWLRKDDHVLTRSGPPTWKSLVKFLEVTNNTGIAKNIRKDKKVS